MTTFRITYSLTFSKPVMGFILQSFPPPHLLATQFIFSENQSYSFLKTLTFQVYFIQICVITYSSPLFFPTEIVAYHIQGVVYVIYLWDLSFQYTELYCSYCIAEQYSFVWMQLFRQNSFQSCVIINSVVTDNLYSINFAKQFTK